MGQEIPNYEATVSKILLEKLLPHIASENPCDLKFLHLRKRKEDDLKLIHSEFISFSFKFIGLVGMAVNMLGPDMEPFNEYISEIGFICVALGIEPKCFVVIGQKFIEALESVLGKNRFSHRTKEAWKVVHQYASHLMNDASKANIHEKSNSRK